MTYYKSSGTFIHIVNCIFLFQDFKVPRDSQEFVRDWRRHYKSTQEQYQYLIDLGVETLGKIFRTEVSLFGDILKALDKELTQEDTKKVIDILENLSATNRFSLSVQFLSSAEREARNSLFIKLKSCDRTKGCDSLMRRVEDLMDKYEIKR